MRAQLWSRVGRPRGSSAIEASTARQMSAPQYVAFNCGRRICRKGLLGGLDKPFQASQLPGWLTHRERKTMLLMGDDEFNHWAGQGALFQYVRMLKSLKGY